jgi:hypothetical protein
MDHTGTSLTPQPRAQRANKKPEQRNYRELTQGGPTMSSPFRIVSAAAASASEPARRQEQKTNKVNRELAQKGGVGRANDEFSVQNSLSGSRERQRANNIS